MGRHLVEPEDMPEGLTLILAVAKVQVLTLAEVKVWRPQTKMEIMPGKIH